MNIYVGNLDKTVTEDEVKQAFEAYGSVKSVRIIKDTQTGESKGFGFVEIRNTAQALTAIKELDGKPMGGKAIKVSQARSHRQQQRYDFGRGGARAKWYTNN